MVEERFDFAEARRFVKEGAKAFFTRMHEKHPDETFYVYVAYGTDDDPKLVTLTANSEGGYTRVVEKYRARYAEDPRRGEVNPNYFRWGFPEWGYGGGAQDMDPFYEIIAKAEENEEDDDEFPGPDTNVELRSQAYAAMMLGLWDLDREGFFGTGEARDKVVLYCSMLDSEETAWFESETARLLNPPHVFDRFFVEWSAGMGMAKDLERSRENPSSIRKAFFELMKQYMK